MRHLKLTPQQSGRNDARAMVRAGHSREYLRAMCEIVMTRFGQSAIEYRIGFDGYLQDHDRTIHSHRCSDARAE